MPTKQLKPGVEVDAWCTKCRMDLLHRIIAMNGPKIVRVECRTCNGHHNYRKPKAAHSAEAKSASARPAAASASGSARKSVPHTSAKRAAEMAAEAKRETVWEKAVLGQPIASFKAYRASQTFTMGDLIRHGKFGDGYIVRVIDRQKVEVMFKDGPRTLAQALEG